MLWKAITESKAVGVKLFLPCAWGIRFKRRWGIRTSKRLVRRASWRYNILAGKQIRFYRRQNFACLLGSLCKLWGRARKDFYLKEFIESTKSHITGLTGRNYSSDENSPDYVLMFIPIESCYSLLFAMTTNFGMRHGKIKLCLFRLRLCLLRWRLLTNSIQFQGKIKMRLRFQDFHPKCCQSSRTCSKYFRCKKRLSSGFGQITWERQYFD